MIVQSRATHPTRKNALGNRVPPHRGQFQGMGPGPYQPTSCGSGNQGKTEWHSHRRYIAFERHDLCRGRRGLLDAFPSHDPMGHGRISFGGLTSNARYRTSVACSVAVRSRWQTLLQSRPFWIAGRPTPPSCRGRLRLAGFSGCIVPRAVCLGSANRTNEDLSRALSCVYRK